MLIVVWALKHFKNCVHGKPQKLFTNHASLQTRLRKNRDEKTARLTKWLDRISYFDVKVQHVPVSQIKLMDYPCRQSYADADIDIHFDEE